MSVVTAVPEQYTPAQQKVYHFAMNLKKPFNAEDLKSKLGCTDEEAELWFEWLKSTGDFKAVRGGE